MIKNLLSTDLSKLVSAHYSVLLLRVGAGGLILTHGLPKLIKVFSGDFSFYDPLGLGPELSLILSAFAEGICGICIAIGLGTRLAAIALIINMSTAFFVVHASDPFAVKEKAMLYLLMFVVLLITGSGKFSLDAKLAK